MSAFNPFLPFAHLALRMRKPIFHIAIKAAFRRDSKTYQPESIVSNGFIHCAEAHQIMDVANRKFFGREDAILLRIDPERVTAELRYENLSGGGEIFPHIYGALNSDAITAVEPLRIADMGAFEPPTCLK